jgi:hypothetical protein
MGTMSRRLALFNYAWMLLVMFGLVYRIHYLNTEVLDLQNSLDYTRDMCKTLLRNE